MNQENSSKALTRQGAPAPQIDRSRVAAQVVLLLAEHDEMEQLFAAHQEALVERNLPAAREKLDQYCCLVTAHIQREKLELLPIYAALGPAPRGGAAELFHSEHEKILKRIAQLEALMRELEAQQPLRARDLIAALDRQFSFKHLMEHHDLRERQFFFPALVTWSS